ncbi:endonuclease domain-containing protein [Devosia sp.]|uniref:endonuclease domain-containing protein n=1 Tax=Devosia sp. TaxID=1871048 RepID=UPI002FCADB0F
MSKDLRRKLRRDPTLAERALWQLLWPWRTGGYHFRKQVEIGPYYVDFACIHAQLIIEVDGDTHGGEIAQANDLTRDEYLKARGFTVLRFSNDDVLNNADGVYQIIAGTLEHRPTSHHASPPPQPSPQGGGCDPVEPATSRQDQ